MYNYGFELVVYYFPPLSWTSFYYHCHIKQCMRQYRLDPNAAVFVSLIHSFNTHVHYMCGKGREDTEKVGNGQVVTA